MYESFKQKVMRKLTAWLDPKLARYRPPVKKTPYAPKTQQELIGVLKRTPSDILSANQRDLIAGAMSFDQLPISLIMTERKDMMFLSDSDFLGPLLLDKMYQTGAANFPVLDHDGEVCGLVRMRDLDPLKITEDQPVEQFIEKTVCFARADYSLQMLLATFIRTESCYAIVVDHDAHIVGSVTLDALMAMLFGHRIKDSFTSDDSPYSVARRSAK